MNGFTAVAPARVCCGSGPNIELLEKLLIVLGLLHLDVAWGCEDLWVLERQT
jgi:hypothetical protein